MNERSIFDRPRLAISILIALSALLLNTMASEVFGADSDEPVTLHLKKSQDCSFVLRLMEATLCDETTEKEAPDLTPTLWTFPRGLSLMIDERTTGELHCVLTSVPTHALLLAHLLLSEHTLPPPQA